MNVLIVDDSKAMRSIIGKAVQGIGLQDASYSYAENADAGMEIIRAQGPDLVLCDLHMPKKNGLELLRELRSAGNQTKVVIVSIDDTQATVREILAQGNSGFLKKPFTQEQMRKVVFGLSAAPDSTSSPSTPSPEKFSNGGNSRPQLGTTLSELSRVLSGLAKSQVRFDESSPDEIDYGQLPFYSCTLQNGKGEVVMALCLDVTSANLLAAIIGRMPLPAAFQEAGNGRLSQLTAQLLLAFMALLCGLFKPDSSGQLLDISQEKVIENSNSRLLDYVKTHREALLVYDLYCGEKPGGKVIFIRMY